MHVRKVGGFAGSDILVGWCGRTNRNLRWVKHVIDRPGGLLSIRNSGVISYGGAELVLNAGDMVFFDALPRHEFSCADEWSYYYFHVPEEMAAMAKEIPCNTAVPGVRHAHFVKTELTRIRMEMQEAYSLFLLRSKGWEDLVFPLLHLILARFFQALPRGSRQEESRLRLAARKLESFGFSRNMTALAKVCGMSRTDFFRKFRAEYGSSPIEYRDHLIIARAKIMLCSTNFQVQEIARQLNFQDPYYFTKFFYSRTGFTPSGYRTKNQPL